MRKPTELEKAVYQSWCVQYFDMYGNNTFYYNISKNYWSDKTWMMMEDRTFREIYVHDSNGYWRKHEYDTKTGRLIREIDSDGNTNLTTARHKWNKKLNEGLSESYHTSLSAKHPLKKKENGPKLNIIKSKELF